MALFGRKTQKPQLLVSQSTLGTLGANQVPARLRVAAVTPPEQGSRPDAAVISGLLLGQFPVEIVQLTVALAEESWPAPGQELPAVADPDNPLVFALVLGPTKPTQATGPQDLRADTSTWDPGPNGSHLRAAAEFLAEAGFIADDFGPRLDTTCPGLSALLDAAAARHITVVPGARSSELWTVGLPAQGMVVEARKLAMPVQLMPTPDAFYAWLTLDVTPSAGRPYRTTIRWGFRSEERFTELATPGTPLPLRVDPADRTQVAVDSPALGSTPIVRSRSESW